MCIRDRCDVDSMAYIAISTLLDRLKSKELRRQEPRSILVPGSIRLRGSVAPPSRR